MSQIRTFLGGAATMGIAIIAVASLTGAKAPPTRFEEITVGRINIEEPDGTKRLVISNRAQFPGAFEKGKEIARPDRTSFAGMLFINDEGTENGGLIQRGKIGPDGKVDAGLSLTFDRFRQDQALQLLHTDRHKYSSTAVMINDVPDPDIASLEDVRKFGEAAAKLPPEERSAYWKKLAEDGRLMQKRVFLGTTMDKASALILCDSKGKPRMMLMVSAKGEPEIRLLDENGKVTKTLSAAN